MQCPSCGQRFFTNGLAFTTLTFSVQLSSLLLFALFFALHFHIIGLLGNLMWIIHFFMVLFQKMSTWLNHLALFIQISLIMPANYKRLYMDSNKLPVHGIMSWKILFSLLVSLMLDQTPSYLFMLMMASLLIFLFMWMILFSLVITTFFLQVLSNGYLQGFPLKILGHFITS